MNSQLLKSKFRALSIHLCISAAILAALMTMIIFWWYPGIWFAIDGGWQGTRIMVLVDMVLGPVLTLIIFNPAKTRRHIIFDLSCIGLIQAAALAWGIHAVHSQRPLAIVYWDTAVYSVDAYELAQFNTDVSDLEKFNQTLPIMIAARAPKTDEEKTAVAISAFMDGPKMYADIERFAAISDHLDAMRKASVDILNIASKKPDVEAALQSFLKSRPKSHIEDYIFLPFYGRFGFYHLIFDQQGNIIDRLPG